MFSKLFKKPIIEEDTIKNTPNSGDDMTLDQQIVWLKSNGWCKDFYIDKKTVLIMDDREEIISSIIDDLLSLNELDNFNFDDYNIITVSSKMAGFDVLEILEKAKDIEIHYALLDIVLGGKKVIDGKRKMVDGVDIAISILEHHPSAEILFFSGCIIDDNNDPQSFKNRFDNYMGSDMNNYLLPKDSDFNDELNILSEFFTGF